MYIEETAERGENQISEYLTDRRRSDDDDDDDGEDDDGNDEDKSSRRRWFNLFFLLNQFTLFHNSFYLLNSIGIW